MTNITQNNNFEELLESDDELPMNYNDLSVTPVYQIDSRFDKIQFKWINNVKTYDSSTPSDTDSNTEISTPLSEDEIPFINIKNNLNPKPLVERGVMHKCDLFCLKSIEGVTDDSTLIWLINFLLYKDLQSGKMFLKSCLVSGIFCATKHLINSI